jgi:hypothetical protein
MGVDRFGIINMSMYEEYPDGLDVLRLRILNAVFKVFLSAIALAGGYNNDTGTPLFM